MDQRRLPQSRHSLQQNVAAADDSDHHIFDDLLLSDNEFRDLVRDVFECRNEVLRSLLRIGFRN